MKFQKGFLVSLLLLCSTLVQGADYEEISYDDLVNQLHKKKSSVIQDANDPFDSIKLHAGLGLIGSANNVNVGNGSRDTIKYQNGFQISLGIDLFSPQWAAEMALRNFGQAHSGTETRSLREFDMKFMHRDLIKNSTGYRVGAGIGNRYLRIDDAPNGVSIDDNTPSALLFAGLDAYVNKTFSIGAEAGLRSSMVNKTADRNSMDLTIRLDTYF